MAETGQDRRDGVVTALDRARPAEAAPPEPAATPAPDGRRRSRLRRRLLLLGPVVAVVLGGYAYLASGRYVSTDNAYVRADKLNLATDIAGIVSEISVHENQRVEKGQVLFRLDDRPYRIALAGAEAQLGITRNEIAGLQATYRQNLAQIEQARTDAEFYRTAFARQESLNRRGVATQAVLDQARRDADAARERVTVAERQAEAVLAQLGGNADGRIEDHPRFRAAQAAVDSARRELDHATIRAPAAGIVTNVSALQIGQYLPAAQPAFSLVATDGLWIEANPKETDLTYLKPGDAATVTVDTYPGRTFTGRVLSISPASGAEFSVLPAQNVSGNWVKVVQRVQVRLAVDMPPGGPQLRSGMSANVEIDTGHERTLAGLVGGVRHSVGL